MIQKIDNATVREAVQQAYERCKNETGGKNADYIPYLANVPSTLFGIAACLPDGEVIAVGDTDYKFGIESVSKVPTAILAMNQYSAQEVLTKIGADATGLPFNSIMAILLENDHPSTPLVNAGAISACSMVQPVGDSDGKWKAITGFIEGLAGSQVEVIDELYKSETATNFNNKSIAWLLKNYNRIYDDPDMALDIYTRQCSIGVTAKQLATMAATIANGGKNPVTKQQVFKPELSPKIASMMATVGFYEHTGDWLFTTGLPAKTGVGGGIVVEGKLLHGAHGSGAEIGHLVLNRDETVPCNCGKRGCVEQYCSATGIVRLAKRHLDSTDAPSSLRTLKNLTCKDIFDAGKAGDKEALSILDRYYAYMGEFLGNVCSTVDPEVVVIGGGVSKAGQMLIDGIVPYFRKYVFHAASGARFTLASLGNDAGAYGAFKLALDAFHG